jgi:beta-lactamase superfamily II metal-dependent hydrolase
MVTGHDITEVPRNMRRKLGRAQSRPRRIAEWTVTLALLAWNAPALGADCVQSTSANGTIFRVAPTTSSAAVGKLMPGVATPLIAIVPRWYETRTSTGQPAFVSKQASDIVACPAAAPAAGTGGDFELHAIDVGTGLAVLVLGSNFTLLFDAGTNDDLGRGTDNRVIAYLNTLQPRRSRIDHVLLSHPHRDHVELLPDVFDQLDVGSVWNSGAYNDICGYRHFLKAIADEPGVQYHTATQDAGDELIDIPPKRCYGSDEPQQTLTVPHHSRIDDSAISLGQDASMRILHADGSKHGSFNENSLVVRLDLGRHRVLLMGDAEAGGRKSPTTAPAATSIEGKLLACCAADLKADVLVVGHHGSKTSSRTAFLNAIGARLFVVSAGPTKYGSVILPDVEVVTELEGRGDVFRTDIEDAQCALAPDKVGPDADGRAGGCDNVVVRLSANEGVSGEYRQFSD